MHKPEFSENPISRREFLWPLPKKGGKPTGGAGGSYTDRLEGFITDSLRMTGLSLFTSFGWSIFAESLFTLNPVDVERADLFQESEVMRVNGVNTKFVGVGHAVDLFFAYRRNIEKIISESPFIVLEYFPDPIHKLARSRTEDWQLRAGKNISLQTANYFAAIGRECARAGKDIFVVNPLQHSIGGQVMELYFALGLPTALLLTDIGKLVKIIIGKQVKRRHLLRMLGYGVSGALIGSWWDTLHQAENLREHKGSPLRWNSVDFRDLRSAQGLKIILQNAEEQVGEGQIVPVIQGGAHTDGVVRYLNEPELADLKIKLYKHFDIFSNPVLRYSYDTKKNEWALKEEITI